MPGDANLDGKVDINDLSSVLTNYDKSTGMTWSDGDFNGDGKVDINDLSIVLTNYDKSRRIVRRGSGRRARTVSDVPCRGRADLPASLRPVRASVGT